MPLYMIGKLCAVRKEKPEIRVPVVNITLAVFFLLIIDHSGIDLLDWF